MFITAALVVILFLLVAMPFALLRWLGDSHPATELVVGLFSFLTRSP